MTFLIQNQPVFSFINTLANKFKIPAEPVILKSGFVFQNGGKAKHHIEPGTDKIKLIAEDSEKKKRTDELIGAYNESNKGEDFLKEYVHGLEEMMFMTHHKVRQPVANILGMAALIEKHANSPEDLKKIVEFMKQSALDLDTFTRELTTFISDLEQKGKCK